MMFRTASSAVRSTARATRETGLRVLGGTRSAQAASVDPAKLRVDGTLGPQTTRSLQEWIHQGNSKDPSENLATDGVMGQKTVMALQEMLGAQKRDGILGQKTVSKLQQFLNQQQQEDRAAQSKHKTSVAVPPASVLDVTGEMNAETVRALQRMLVRARAKQRLEKVVPAHEFQKRIKAAREKIQVDKSFYEPAVRDFSPMHLGLDIKPKSFKIYSKSKINDILHAKNVNENHLDFDGVVAAANVLPMRANNYVVDELIDWSKVPEDPIFQLTFPQPGMLDPDDLSMMVDAMRNGASKVKMRELSEVVREKLNPHPAGQKQLNVPSSLEEKEEESSMLTGMQHKYRETTLFFPKEGQFCHAYCTYCFRWAQFTQVGGGSDQQFASGDAKQLFDYLVANPQVNDVLFTGGDPMVMKAADWEGYLNPLIDPKNAKQLEQLQTIRIGTKSLAYWPYRYISDHDASDMLRLMERVVQSGRHLSIMAHFSHPAELSTPAVQEAIRRIRSTGANIRTQAPLIANVNDDAETWATMWRNQVRMGLVPYYMFVERDTGARKYFEVPLHRAVRIFQDAFQSQSGIARTVRGPSMSATPGKVHVLGVEEIAGEKVFALKFLQARNPEWQNQMFFAKYDEEACWLDDLKPAFGADEFFWEPEMRKLNEWSMGQSEDGDEIRLGSSGQHFPTNFEYKNLVVPS